MEGSVLPEDVRLYLSRTALLVRDGEVDLEGADAFLLDNILKQCDGLESEVLSDKKGSKALETVLRLCSYAQLQGFVHRLMMKLGNADAPYATLCTNPYASHALQTLFQRIGVVMHADLPPADASVMVGGVLQAPLPALLSQWLMHMGEDLLGMAGNRSASHVLRALMMCVGGVCWASQAAASQFQLASGVVATERPPSPANAALFDHIVSRFLEALTNQEEASRFFRDSSASATLQLAVVVCDVRGRAELRDSLVAAMIPSEDSARALLCDSVGSRLMEVLICRASPLVFAEKLWGRVLAPRSRDWALDACANYALQQGLRRAAAEGLALDGALENIVRPSLTALFQRGRIGVLVEICRAASQAGAGGAAWRKRLLPLLWQGDVPRPLPVQLLGEVKAQGAGVSRPVIELCCVVHSFGAEGATLLDPFWDALTEEEVKLVCACRAWSEVAEAMLRGGSSVATKRRFARKMQSSLEELARDKYAHHVVLTALAWLQDGSDAADLRLAREWTLLLKAARESLVRVQWGEKLLKKLAEMGARRHEETEQKPLSVASLLGEGEDAEEASKPTTKRQKKEEGKRARKLDSHHDGATGAKSQEEEGEKKKKKKKRKQKKQKK